MSPSSLAIPKLVEQAATIIRQAQNGVALTGAGISTPSGIPDFRSPGSVLWKRDLPMEVASLAVFRHHPQRFFDWIRTLARHILSAEPNQAHKSLARLEVAGHIKTIITQNIDMLHKRAGSSNVLEIHGTFATLSCLHCYQQIESTPKILNDYLGKGIIPRCPSCQEILKPDVILFGEQLPAKQWNAAQKAIDQCDILLVIGSSLTVVPVAELPKRAMKRDLYLIILNKMGTYLDKQADVVIHCDVAEILPKITQKVLYA